MKLKKVLENKDKFNKIEKKLNKLNKKLQKKFYVFTAAPFIATVLFLSITDFIHFLPLFFLGSFFGGIIFLIINYFILCSLYKISHELDIFIFYNSESEKFSNKYYEYLKLKKKGNIYYENLINAIKNSKEEEIISYEKELNYEIENIDEIKSNKLTKVIVEKLNNGKEKEKLKKLFEEKRKKIKKEVLINI